MKKIFTILLVFCFSSTSLSQDNIAEIHGNFETNLQSYFVDSSIGANEPTPERILNNAYLNNFHILILQ
jgi:hypothetical protein